MKKYPLLDHVSHIFNDVDLSKTILICCQHLLGTQLVMFQHLFNRGLLPYHCFIIGKNYSTNDEVIEELRDIRCYVDNASNQYDPLRSFDEWFSEKVEDFLKFVMKNSNEADFNSIVILDDGGMLISATAKSSLPLYKVRAVEQTSSGWTRLKKEHIPFEVFYVARTHAKLLYETPHITKLCLDRIKEYINDRQLLDPKVLIIGNQGHIGKSLQKHFSFEGYDVSGFDIKEGTLTECVQHINTFDIIVGTTGTQSITKSDLALLKPSVSLISVSSSDREFPALLFRKEGSALHQNHFHGEQCLVNSGFPITFYGNYHELQPQQIEITCSLLFFGVIVACLKPNDWRIDGQYTALIVNRLSTMYFRNGIVKTQKKQKTR